MIILDTSVLVYAVGSDHPLTRPCERLVEAIRAGRVRATTTPEVIQEFAHVRSRRRSRHDAAVLGHAYVDLLSPLIVVESEDVVRGLRLFERHSHLDAFDAVLAAVAIERQAEALLSGDRAYGAVRGVPYVDPATPALDELLGEG